MAGCRPYVSRYLAGIMVTLLAAWATPAWAQDADADRLARGKAMTAHNACGDMPNTSAPGEIVIFARREEIERHNSAYRLPYRDSAFGASAFAGAVRGGGVDPIESSPETPLPAN
jgi:hypothetical protein